MSSSFLFFVESSIEFIDFKYIKPKIIWNQPFHANKSNYIGLLIAAQNQWVENYDEEPFECLVNINALVVLELTHRRGYFIIMIIGSTDTNSV